MVCARWYGRRVQAEIERFLVTSQPWVSLCRTLFAGGFSGRFVSRCRFTMTENRNVSLNRCSTMTYIPARRSLSAMKTFVGILGAILIILSILLFLMAFVLWGRPNAPIGFVFLLAIVSLVIGIALDRTASRKQCPRCAESIRIKALTCRYCGHTFT